MVSCDILLKRPRTVFAVAMAFYMCALSVPLFTAASAGRTYFIEPQAFQSGWAGYAIIADMAGALAFVSAYGSTPPNGTPIQRACGMAISAPLKLGAGFYFCADSIMAYQKSIEKCTIFPNSPSWLLNPRCPGGEEATSSLGAAGFFMLVAGGLVVLGQLVGVCRRGKDPDWLGSVGAKFTFVCIWLTQATVYFTWAGQVSSVTADGESPFRTGYAFAAIFATSGWILSMISVFIYSRAYKASAGIKPTATFFTAGLGAYSFALMTVTWAMYNALGAIDGSGRPSFEKLKAALIIAGLATLIASLGQLYGTYLLTCKDKVLSHALFLIAFAAWLMQQAVCFFVVYEYWNGTITYEQVRTGSSPQAIFLLTSACCLFAASFFLGKEGSEGVESEADTTRAAGGKGAGGGSAPAPGAEPARQEFTKPEKEKKSWFGGSKKKAADTKPETKTEVPNPQQTIEVREPTAPAEEGASWMNEDGVPSSQPGGPVSTLQKKDSEPSWMQGSDGTV